MKIRFENVIIKTNASEYSFDKRSKNIIDVFFAKMGLDTSEKITDEIDKVYGKYSYKLTLFYHFHSINLHSLTIQKLEADEITCKRIQYLLTKKYNIGAISIKERLFLSE